MRSALIVVALLAILAAAGFYAYAGLSKGGDTPIGVHGWITMFLGIVFSLVWRWPDVACLLQQPSRLRRAVIVRPPQDS